MGLLLGAGAFAHCLGMCGPIALHLAKGPGRMAVIATQLAWHGGRIFSYIFLGALCGYAGGLLGGLTARPWAMRVPAVLALSTGAMAVLVGPLVRGAWQEVRRARLSLDALIAVGSLAAYGVSAAAVPGGAGNVYFTGYGGGLGGTNQGGSDAFLTEYSSTGSLAWTTQLGTSSFDEARGVAVDSAGNTYITGETQGSLGGTNPSPGIDDAFLAKYEVPEPAMLALLALGGLAVLRRRKRM